MADTLNCKCGQNLDVSGFRAGDQVRCPKCGQVLTVPGAASAAATPTGSVAMAVVVDDESDVHPPAAAAPAGRPARRAMSPMEQRRLNERRSAQAAQRKLQRVMIWPCLILGLLSLISAGLGVYWHFGPKTIEIETDADGIQHLYARVPKENNPGETERVEVQPDIWPIAEVVTESKVMYVFVGDNLTPFERRGLWFYEIEPATRKPKIDPATEEPKRLENLPLKAQARGTEGDYVPVDIKGTEFFKAGTSAPVSVVYYRVVEGGVQDKAIDGDFEDFGPPLGLSPAVFILGGLPIGLLLLFASGFFGYQAYFSRAAREMARKAAADKAVQEEREKKAAAEKPAPSQGP